MYRKDFGIKVSLNDAIALTKSVVHFHKEAWVYEIVRIKNDDGIVFLFHLEEALEHPFHGEALALFRRMRPFTDDAAVTACNFCRVVVAVVGDDKDIVKCLWIIQRL